MAELSRPWSGIVLGDSGPYSDDQWSDTWASKSAPTIATEGIFRGQLNELDTAGAVSPVVINTGRAMVDGVWYENNVAVNVAVPNPAANPRVDRIVLRKSWAAQTVRITRIAGAEAAAPVPPALVQNDTVTWDTPLWQVYITVPGAIEPWADERDWIGQYEPAGYLTGTRVYLEDDFFEGVSPFIHGSNRRFWYVEDATGGQITLLDLAGFGAGGIKLAYPNATPVSGVNLNSVVQRPDQINARLMMRLYEVNTHANLDRAFGFVSSEGTVTPANGVFFRSVGAANWEAVTRNGGVESATATGQALTAAWKLFEIRMRGSTLVEFLIDGVVVATHSPTLPVAASIPANIGMLLILGLIDSAAPAADIYEYVDLARLEGDR